MTESYESQRTGLNCRPRTSENNPSAPRSRDKRGADASNRAAAAVESPPPPSPTPTQRQTGAVDSYIGRRPCGCINSWASFELGKRELARSVARMLRDGEVISAVNTDEVRSQVGKRCPQCEPPPRKLSAPEPGFALTMEPEHAPPLTDAERAAKDGACCYCGYSGSEESSCPKRSDGVHCDHWWGSDDESPAATPTEEQGLGVHAPNSEASLGSASPAPVSSSPDVAALLADALRVSNAIYNGARNAAHDSPDMNMCSGCEWARLIDRLAAALRESEEREPFEKREYRAARRYILGRNGMSPFYDDGTIKNLTSLIVKLEDVVRVEAERASEAERERLQRELDVADVLAHEEIARLQTALATFEALAEEAMQAFAAKGSRAVQFDRRSSVLGKLAALASPSAKEGA